MKLLNRVAGAVARRIDPYHGLNGLDRKLEPYVDFDNGFYVELGANDGITQSNTLYFEERRNWRGVLIEPSPSRFLQCVDRRGKKNHVVCAACVPNDYPERFVEMEYADLMTVAKSLDSDLDSQTAHLDAANRHMRGTERRFIDGALARRLTDILDEANAPRGIDFMSLDVEGAELAVLGGLDLTRYNFRYMLIETRSPEAVAEHLGRFGYRKLDTFSHHDILYAGPTT